MPTVVVSIRGSRALLYLKRKTAVKSFFILFVLVAVVLAAYPFLNDSDDRDPLTGLPWQIEILPDGSTLVFGLQVGSSRLSDALATLGNDMELAIIASFEEAGNLEMYYGHYRAGLLSGKLVLQTETSEQKVKLWRDRAIKTEYMATGQAKKYYLLEEDLPEVLAETITGLTFIPSANLDENVILARFGQPSERIVQGDALHFLYPDKGLDLAYYENAKEILQYVSPATFEQHIQPLRQ